MATGSNPYLATLTIADISLCGAILFGTLLSTTFFSVMPFSRTLSPGARSISQAIAFFCLITHMVKEIVNTLNKRPEIQYTRANGASVAVAHWPSH